MSIDRLKRVMWRLTELKKKSYSVRDLERTIMIECGTDPKTYINNRKALLKLGWLWRRQRRFYPSGKHIQDDF